MTAPVSVTGTFRPCRQCGRRILRPTSRAAFCQPCKAIRRELSRTVPRGSYAWPSHHEPADHVERLLRAAAQRRKRREAVEGRTFTVDPWAQRPGVNSFDRGEGEGFA